MNNTVARAVLVGAAALAFTGLATGSASATTTTPAAASAHAPAPQSLRAQGGLGDVVDDLLKSVGGSLEGLLG
ncbi:hypothetical protein [Actinomadura rubrisoli]|uniref:Secreted protein n=1 Tax=Actinomadura rubrisoli TaxID=2530368 RepID=A0A4R5B448_9ACTN|nr:hypothetical protein [Actinomadura rubrisoli]TDD80978.1 hypothetical protein E1298_24840 [Actinomadura rubrisoli]